MKTGTTIGLGGGCHWCTEAVVKALRGVLSVDQGFIASVPPDDAFSEAVRVTFDEAELPLGVLLEVHARTHASQSQHSMRDRYRSAVYARDRVMASRCRRRLAGLTPLFERPLIISVLPLVAFEASPERFRDYYERRPDAPFCTRHIAPKLRLLQRRFPDRLHSCGATGDPHRISRSVQPR